MTDELLRPYQRAAMAMIIDRNPGNMLVLHRPSAFCPHGAPALPGGFSGGLISRETIRREAREEGPPVDTSPSTAR